MQNLFDVASLSPPQVTNATKVVVKTATPTDQISFDLVLSMASEKIKTGQSRNDANHEKEYDSMSTERASNSFSNTRSKVVQNRKEIDKSETENKKKADDDKANEDDVIPVMSNGQAVEKQELSGTTEEENPEMAVSSTVLEDYQKSVELANTDEQNNAVNPVVSNSVNAVVIEINDQVSSLTNSLEETNAKTIDDASESFSTIDIESNDATKKEDAAKLKDSFSKQGLKENDSLADNILFSQKEVQQKKVEEIENKLNLNTTNSIENDLEQVGSNVRIEASKNNVVNETDLKAEIKTSVKADSAPPGSADMTESVLTNPSAQSTQINEQARLAEAPKTKLVTQVASEIDQMVKANKSSLRVQLYPEELGHIDLKIVSTKNGVGVTMIADRASTQDVLKSEINTLKQTIEQAGIQLSDLNVGQGKNSNQQQFFEERTNYSRSTSQSSNVDPLNSESIDQNITLQNTVVDYKV